MLAQKRRSADEVHPLLAQGSSGDLGIPAAAHREAVLHGARGRERRRSRRQARTLHHRPRARGQAPPQRRQAAGVQGRHRLRRGRGRVRRPQRQDRHDRRVRADGQLHPRHQDHAGGQARARRRLATACWSPSASSSSPTITRASSSSTPSSASKLGERYADVLGLSDPVLDVKLTPNRPDCTGVRGIARDLAAAGLGKLKPEKKISRRRGRLRLPRRHRARVPQGGARRLPLLRRPLHQGRQQRRLTGLDAAAPQGRRPAPHQRAGRRHQLHQPRPRPAAARLRRRQAHRRHPRPARPQGREIRRPRRQDARGRRHHVRDRRRPRRAGLRRHPRRRGHRLHGSHQERADRVRLLRSAAHRRHGPQGRHRLATRAIASSAASTRPSSCRASTSPPP